MAFHNAPLFVKVATVLIPIATAMQVIGFVTSYWSTRSSGAHNGIWFHTNYDSPSWLEATQAFETLGFIAGLAALVLIVLYIFVPSTAGKKIVFILAMLGCFVAAGCIILGIIIYGSKMDNLSWSFALCTIAGVVFGVAGVLLLLDFCKR